MKDKKDIQYKIFKSEACGHVVEYKMVKKEHELEKARIDEGKTGKEKKAARRERNRRFTGTPTEWQPHKRGDEELHDKRAATDGERSIRMIRIKHDLQAKHGKNPSKEDLEYPMAASEKEECLCKDCDCDKKDTDQKVRETKGIKYDEEHKSDKDKEKFKRPIEKSEKFYIQKIQELRKQMTFSPGKTPIANNTLSAQNPIVLTPEQQKMAADNLNNIISNRGRNVAEDSAKKYQQQQQQKFGTLSQGPQTPEQLYNPVPQLKPNISTTATPTEQPAASQRMQFGKDSGVSFKDAFAQARKAGNQEFDWFNPKTGKMQPYHTHTKEEFQQGKTLATGRNPEGFQSQTIGADNKYFKGWQAQQKAPAAQTPAAKTPAANKMNSAQTPAAKTPAENKTNTTDPAENKTDSFEKLTGKNLNKQFEQIFPTSVSRNEGGSTVKTFSDGRKEITN